MSWIYLENLKNDIKTAIHFPIHTHKQKAMSGIIKGNSPISEEIHATTLSLSISDFHSDNEIYKEVETLNSF